jgi:hypothetical protein
MSGVTYGVIASSTLGRISVKQGCQNCVAQQGNPGVKERDLKSPGKREGLLSTCQEPVGNGTPGAQVKPKLSCGSACRFGQPKGKSRVFFAFFCERARKPSYAAYYYSPVLLAPLSRP